MTICNSCNHENPEGAVQCEQCYAPLPALATCPQCQAPVQTDARFCGQCGANLQPPAMPSPVSVPATPAPPAEPPVVDPRETLSQAFPAPHEPTHIEKTQLQMGTARLCHVQTNTTIELPSGLDVIHIGKPNDRIPPDIDVSGFPHSEVVSRVHADIRVEGDAYFLEDSGSANGTYINGLPLLPGNRHRLRSGDCIALGKGSLVTFLFQLP